MAKKQQTQGTQGEGDGISRLLKSAARRAADGLARTGRYRQGEIEAAVAAIKLENVSPDVRRGLDMLLLAHGIEPHAEPMD